MKAIILISIFTVLVGCASSNKNLSPGMEAAFHKPLVCAGDSQCKLYWDRANFYVNSNSRYKIQTANDNLIQTFSPTGGSTNLGYNISREPLGSGKYRIWIKTWCDNMFGCYPDQREEVAKFKMYVSG